MNKLDKFLLKLDRKNRLVIGQVVEKIVSGDVSNFDIKKLKGDKDLYRIRVGKIRIIFNRIDNVTKLQGISFKDENTYS